MLKFFVKKYEKQDEKTKIITINIILSALVKVVSIGTNFLLVPLTLAYLSELEYGIWITMSSFLGWFSIFDLGIGNGLRNKLTESLARKDYASAKIYVSTAYGMLGFIFAIVFFIFSIISFFVDWSKVYNASSDIAQELLIATVIMCASLCTQFVLKLISTILISHHKVAWSDALNTFIQVILLLTIWKIDMISQSNKLITFAIVHLTIPIIILLIVNWRLFNRQYHYIKPSASNINLTYFSAIGSLGLKFFAIQIAVIIIFSTDNMIITQLFGAEAVTPYSIAQKIFMSFFSIAGLLLYPMWSAYTEAYAKGEFEWMKSKIYTFMYMYIGFVVGIISLVFIFEPLKKIWVGDIQVSNSLIWFTALTFCIMFWNNMFAMLINGVGKIHVQLITALSGAVINIPLSIWLAKYCGMGPSGVIFATFISLLIGGVFVSYQTYLIVNQKDYGIWSK